MFNRRRNPNVEPIATPEGSPYLAEGRVLFNSGQHWHAHEAWEHLWLGLEGDDKVRIQGLIMAAALLVQYGKDVRQGVINHGKNVRARLGDAPRGWAGLDVPDLLEQLTPFIEDAAGDADLTRDVRLVQLRTF